MGLEMLEYGPTMLQLLLISLERGTSYFIGPTSTIKGLKQPNLYSTSITYIVLHNN